MENYDIHLEKQEGRAWTRGTVTVPLATDGGAVCMPVSGYVKGYAFVEGTLCRERRLLAALAAALSVSEASARKAALCRLNGSFSAVLQIGDAWYLVADKMRSHPLLYAERHGRLLVTDEAEWLLQRMGGVSFDDTAMAMFMAGAYVYGAQTIVQGCRSVPAGSYVRAGAAEPVSGADSSWIISEEVYHDFIVEPVSALSEQVLFDGAEAALEAAFDRLLASVDGRTLAIPLSGGYDSRLMACLCKKRGLKNVLCYTYGPRNSAEVAMSGRVAEQLGYPWHYVEYTPDTTRQFYADERYVRYTLNLVSRYHRQDFQAVKTLVERGVLTADCVVVPGHSGDLLPVVYTGSWRGLSRRLYEKHFSLNVLYPSARRKVQAVVKAYVRAHAACWKTAVQMNFNIVARQANYIVNSARVYEFFGMDWRIPLWDDAYAEYWLAYRPADEKSKPALYERFMFERYFVPCRVDFPKTVPPVSRWARLKTSVSLPDGLKHMLKAGWRKLRPRAGAGADVNGTAPAIRVLQEKIGAAPSAYVRWVGQTQTDMAYGLLWLEQWYKRLLTGQASSSSRD